MLDAEVQRLACVAAMRRQDTPFPTQGLGSSEPELSVENLKRQLSDKDVEISQLRVRPSHFRTSMQRAASEKLRCGNCFGTRSLINAAEPMQEEVRQLRLVSERDRRTSIPEHQPA